MQVTESLRKFSKQATALTKFLLLPFTKLCEQDFWAFKSIKVKNRNRIDANSNISGYTNYLGEMVILMMSLLFYFLRLMLSKCYIYTGLIRWILMILLRFLSTNSFYQHWLINFSKWFFNSSFILRNLRKVYICVCMYRQLYTCMHAKDNNRVINKRLLSIKIYCIRMNFCEAVN